MFKKLAIGLGIFSLFVGIMFAQAGMETVVKVNESQYINPLKLTWGKTQVDFLKLINTFYERVEGAGEWQLDCNEYGNCDPYYMVGNKKVLSSTVYSFGSEDKLTSFHAFYEPHAYTTIVNRVEKDFKNGGSITTDKFVLRVYEKTYRNSIITIEMEYRGVETLVKFSADYKALPQKKEEPADENVTAKRDHRDIYWAAHRVLFAHYYIINSHVNH